MQYTNIVLGIPHAVGKPSDIDWTNNPKVVEAVNRWTDWFTDELFLVGRGGVSAVLGSVSRFDCDVERLEDESDRVCRFCSLCGEGLEREVPASRWNRRLAQWFKYRYGLMLARLKVRVRSSWTVTRFRRICPPMWTSTLGITMTGAVRRMK